MGDEQYERGCFEGEVLSRLSTIERNQADVWTEIKNQRNEIKEINDRLEQARAEARGYIVAGKAIWAVVGALIAAVGVWFSHKGAKP